MKRVSLILFLTLACATPKDVQMESKKVNDFFETSFRKQLDRSPMFKTNLGIHEDYDKLDDISDEQAEREIEITKAELKELKSFNYEALDEATKLSYRIFEYMANVSIENFKYRYLNYPVNQMSGPHSELPSFMINMHQIENISDAEAYISRLKKFPIFFSQLTKLVQTRAEKGVIPPKFVFAPVIGDSKNVIQGFPFDKSKKSNPLWEDFSAKLEKLKLPKDQNQRLLDEAKQALISEVGPSIQNLITYLTSLQSKAPENGGAFYLPDAKDHYAMRLKNHTTTTMDGEAVHQLGLKEVARIHGEMAQIMKQVKFKGNLTEFFTFMRTSPQFYFKNNADGKKAYLKKSVEIIDQMKAKIPTLFGTLPKAPIIVKAVESFREKSAGTAFYENASEDGKRPGTYYVNLLNTESQPIFEMEALAYHEGIPGHHMQISIAQELKDLPRFRKYAWITAYGEGWALYSEQIPKEIGFYKDPYSDFGRLSMELWRAGRLVVDSGIHSKGWTRQQAIDYLQANTSSDLANTTKEVERYIVWPGQATAYLIGKLKILDLREKAKAKLKEKFDLRGFHDEVLRNGNLPLAILEENINRWVEKRSQ